MITNDEVWIAESDAWGLDRLAWEEDEDGLPVSQGDPPGTPPDERD